MADVALHWSGIWESRSSPDTSWHQEDPQPCLALVRSVSTPSSRVALVGVGVSPLIDRLLADGYGHLEVVDISPAALAALSTRLGAGADTVGFRQADVRAVGFDHPVDVWHDRATFHFLTDPADRLAYVRCAARAVPPGGHVVVGTFALDGPEQCSGLPVVRYDATTLAAEFAGCFELVTSAGHDHITPWGGHQAFIHVVLQRSPERLNTCVTDGSAVGDRPSAEQ